MKNIMTFLTFLVLGQAQAHAVSDVSSKGKLIDSCDMQDARGGDSGNKGPSKIEIRSIYDGKAMYAFATLIDTDDEGKLYTEELPKLSAHRVTLEHKHYGDIIRQALAETVASTGLKMSDLVYKAYIGTSFVGAIGADMPEVGFVKVYAKSGKPAGMLGSLGNVGFAIGTCHE